MYCSECGTPLEYTSIKPKFCSNCGYNFIAQAKAPNETATPSSPAGDVIESKRAVDSEDPDSEEFDVKELDPRIYNMQGLAVDISMDKPRGINLGQMFPGLSQEGDEKKQRKK